MVEVQGFLVRHLGGGEVPGNKKVECFDTLYSVLVLFFEDLIQIFDLEDKLRG